MPLREWRCRPMSIDALQDEIRNFPGTAGQPPGQVRLWWRDDDLVANTPAFDRLVGLATERRLPLLVSVIPGLASDRLDLSRADPGLLFFCQHGWKHLNHEPEGAPKSEFGASRPSAEVQSELAAGQAVMGRLLGERVMPVFVPPWNALEPKRASPPPVADTAPAGRPSGRHRTTRSAVA